MRAQIRVFARNEDEWKIIIELFSHYGYSFSLEHKYRPTSCCYVSIIDGVMYYGSEAGAYPIPDFTLEEFIDYLERNKKI